MSGGRRWILAIGAGAALAAILVTGLIWRDARRLQAESAVSHLQAMQVSYKLLPDAFDRLAPDGGDFGVASNGTVFLPTAQGAVAVTNVGFARPAAPQAVQSLAIGVDDAMLTLSGGYLGVLDSRGEPVQAVPLPFDRAHLAPSIHSDAVYLYGGGVGDWRLYRFDASGTFQLLAQSDEPIVGVAEAGDDLLIATGRNLARLTRTGLQLVFRTPDDPDFGPITSVAASPDGLLFAATAKRVYAGPAGALLSIVNDSGGQLRWRDGRLYVLDPTRRLLYALSPADRSVLEARR